MERLYERITKPVSPGDTEAFLAPLTIQRAEAERIIKELVFERTLGPSDIQSAQLDEVRLLLVPFWRVDVSVDGHHIGLSSFTVGNGRMQMPVPTGGSRHKDAVLMIRARRSFPYETTAPAILNKLLADATPIEIASHELEPLATARFDMDLDERVDADVDRAGAEREAKQFLMREVAPSNALYQTYEPTVRSAHFVLYPVYFVRYRYQGEAQRHAGEGYFVALSGHTGKAIACHHPSGLRAAAARFRRLLSFD